MANTVQVALSLGSNINRYQHINTGLKALEACFGQVKCSPVYESAAVGFEGSAFLNLIAIIETDKGLTEIIRELKRIEDENGRDRSGPKFSSRTLDIDVVTYGDCAGEHEGIELPRAELFHNAFVLLPMVDVWPERTVPGRSQTYADLWKAQNLSHQSLAAVPFERR